jgi:hypothetical protein
MDAYKVAHDIKLGFSSLASIGKGVSDQLLIPAPMGQNLFNAGRRAKCGVYKKIYEGVLRYMRLNRGKGTMDLSEWNNLVEGAVNEYEPVFRIDEEHIPGSGWKERIFKSLRRRICDLPGSEKFAVIDVFVNLGPAASYHADKAGDGGNMSFLGKEIVLQDLNIALGACASISDMCPTLSHPADTGAKLLSIARNTKRGVYRRIYDAVVRYVRNSRQNTIHPSDWNLFVENATNEFMLDNRARYSNWIEGGSHQLNILKKHLCDMPEAEKYAVIDTFLSTVMGYRDWNAELHASRAPGAAPEGAAAAAPEAAGGGG